MHFGGMKIHTFKKDNTKLFWRLVNKKKLLKQKIWRSNPFGGIHLGNNHPFVEVFFPLKLLLEFIQMETCKNT